MGDILPIKEFVTCKTEILSCFTSTIDILRGVPFFFYRIGTHHGVPDDPGDGVASAAIGADVGSSGRDVGYILYLCN